MSSVEIEEGERYFSAFTVAELGGLLSAATEIDITRAYGHVMNVPDTTIITPLGLLCCLQRPDLAAKMLIYLLENKLLRTV